MLLIIFGAGASYDSAPRLRPRAEEGNDGWRPPLANDLFADRPTFRELLTNFPRVLPLAARLGQASDEHPLERMLSDLRDEADEYASRHSELAAVRYYLQGLIWECERRWLEQIQAVTNYLALLDRIERRRRGVANSVVYVTFNYDRLFEYAATFYLSDGEQIYQNRFDTLRTYTDNSRFPLVKVHGSIDWGYRVNTRLPIVSESNGHVWKIAYEVIRVFPSLDISNEVEKIVERPPQPKAGFAYIPAIAIPLDTKSDFVCPDSHLTFLKACLANVRSILIIGWQGMEAQFCEMLKAHLPADVSILAVCGEVAAGEQTIETLRGHGIGDSYAPTAGGFSEFVVGHEVDGFLEHAFKDGSAAA